jgi:uncharacterized RDD family membrane protein YckC
VIPEAARVYQGTRAGLVSRVLANGIDVLITLIALGVYYGALSAVLFLYGTGHFDISNVIAWSVPVLGVIFLLGYLTLSWTTTGRTYGDQLLGLRVIDVNGDRLRFGRAMLRALLCVFFPVGVLWVAISAQNRSAQDIVVHTWVIYDWSTNVDPFAASARRLAFGHSVIGRVATTETAASSVAPAKVIMIILFRCTLSFALTPAKNRTPANSTVVST